MHTPISIQNLSIQFKQKTCFEDLTQLVHAGDRIAIIGNNGSGKTSLLKALVGEFKDYDGVIAMPGDIKLGYVPQLLSSKNQISGGEIFNDAFFSALEQMPDCLLLDEPTNHLDQVNRNQLIEQIKYFYGTVIAVTHDEDFMQACFNQIWHIDRGRVIVFSGKYHDYYHQRLQESDKLNKQLKILNQDKKKMHAKLMQEQKRAAKSSAKGAKSIANKKWATVVSNAKAGRAQEVSGKKKAAIQDSKKDILDRLDDLAIVKNIKPTFYLSNQKSSGVILQINDGSIGYKDKNILSKINLSISSGDKVLIQGDNGSGKTTLIKAMMQNNQVMRKGVWLDCDKDKIGYLDQHYQQLPYHLSVLEALQAVVPKWDVTQCYQHLADFLFRGTDSVQMSVTNLSGGEKARLSLALIAAKPPTLLILDEVTNNIDLETKNHMISILLDYPGAMLLISHDQSFLDQLPLNKVLSLKDKEMSEFR